MRIKTASIGFIIGLFLLGSLLIWVSSVSLSKTEKIQGIWVEFEQHRNEKLSVLITLRRELGYGGMIHQFKNYILRQRLDDAKKITSSIGGAKAALTQYKSLQRNENEDLAILQIEQSLDAYQNAINKIASLIGQQKTARQIDYTVKIDDSFALEALKSLENEAEISNNIDSSKPRLLSLLRTAMGYGGLIHNFKNYILRYSPETFTRVEAEADNIKSLVKLYKNNTLSPAEESALNNILSVVQAYQKKLLIIQKMSNRDELARTIDKTAIINDTPALEGFIALQQEININNALRAKQLSEALEVTQKASNIIFYLTLTSFIILIAMAIWLMEWKIVKPIFKLTNTMSRLSQGELDLKIPGIQQNTEVGEMARAVEIFKINAIKKQEIEISLQSFNQRLEEQVHQRTEKLKDNEIKLAAMVEHAVEGEERLKIIIDTSMDAVIQINDEGIVINWNQKAEAIFGWSSNNALGRYLHDLIIPKQYKAKHIDGINRFLATEKMTIINNRLEMIATHQNGHEIPIEITISPVKYKGRYQFSAFARDITDQKRCQSAIIAAKEAAEEANIAKSTFLANMSHELRTPMHGILSFSHFGFKKSDSASREKLHHYFSNIHTSGERLLALLNNLLDLSKIEAGKMEIKMEIADLVTTYTCCYLEQEQHMNDLQLNVQLNKPEHAMTGTFDDIRIKQVIANLLSNAIKFSPEGSSITTTLNKNHKHELCFSIQDSGIGIPENELDSVFDAFIQSSKTKTGAGGTGLGLAICKEIIKGHNGKIWAENSPEGGAIFNFVIPRQVKSE